MAIRNSSFDSAKGLLILLVILGHVLLGSISENIDREIIYFFHMPLFLAITGFFISDKLVSSPLKNIYLKYKYRLIIPFLVGFFFYTSIVWVSSFSHGILDLKKIGHSFLYPFYHLWYIPAVLLFILYIKLLNLLKTKSRILFYISCLTFISITVIFESYGQGISNDFIYKLFGDKRYYSFFTYFYLGYILSKRKINIPIDILIVLFVTCVMVYAYGEKPIFIGLAKVVANMSLICMVIGLLKSSVNYKSLFLSKIGQVSLPIYLWHVAPILILTRLKLPDDIYYLACLMTFLIFIFIAINIKGKVKLLDKYFYGI